MVNDLMQQGYRYRLVEPAGRNFDPRFRPELTPREMLRLGVFGGKYMTDCRAEFPASWFQGARLSPEFRDPELNYFGVNASQPLSVWRQKGWLSAEDPRGWFQWYCRYYLGRRIEDDERQIRRWLGCGATSISSAGRAVLAISTAARASGRRCCTGRTIPGGFDFS